MIIDILEVLQEYRKGNKDVINTLFTLAYKRDCIYEHYSHNEVYINDAGLMKNVQCLFNVFKKPYKAENEKGKCIKHREQIYCGDIEDAKQDGIRVFMSLAEDFSFQPKSSDEVYKRFKYELCKLFNESIKFSAYAIEETAFDEDGEGYSLIDDYADENAEFDLYRIENDYAEDVDTSDNYIGEFRELHDNVLKNDITELLRPDAYVQRNVINLIKNNYYLRWDRIKQERRLPEMVELVGEYNQIYDTEISPVRFSEVLSDLYKILCETTTTLKGATLTRREYKKKNKDRNLEI